MLLCGQIVPYASQQPFLMMNRLGAVQDLKDVTITDVQYVRDHESELGRGSDATVYRGTWHGAFVAVKVLHDELVDPSNAEEGRVALLRRFLREGERLCRLRHPNIVLFLGIFRTRSGVPAVITELMDDTLMARYRALPRLTQVEEFKFLRDVAAGLRYLHSQKIIHRDLTSRNVLVTNDGRAKLGDVGLSRSLHGDRPGDSRMTQAPGTLLYMGPEALREEADYGLQLDVFSFGVLSTALILRQEPDSRLLVSQRYTINADGNMIAIPEVQRRATELEAVGRSHRLHSLIVRCLKNIPSHRPTSAHLHEELVSLVRQTSMDTEPSATVMTSMHAADPMVANMSAEHDRLRAERDDFRCQLAEKIRQLDYLNQQLTDRIQQQDDLTQQRDRLIVSIEERDMCIQELLAQQPQQVSQPLHQLQSQLIQHQDRFAQERHMLSLQLAKPTPASTAHLSADLRSELQALSASGRLFAGALAYERKVANPGPTWFPAGFLQERFPFDVKWIRKSTIGQNDTEAFFLSFPCVYGGFAYALVNFSNETVPARSMDLKNWQYLDSSSTLQEKFSTHMHILFSHENSLYVLRSTPNTGSYQSEISLHRIKNAELDKGKMDADLLFTRDSPPQAGFVSTAFVIGNSLILTGGYENKTSHPTVLEINFQTGKTIQESLWPNLPEPGHAFASIVTNEKVHLIGGLVCKPGQPNRALSTVFTMNLIDSKPVGEWLTNDIPPTPHARCGAIRVLNHIVVAGGRHPINQESVDCFSNECFLLDPIERKWLHLPPLPVPCSRVFLEVFNDEVIAVSGSVKKDEYQAAVDAWQFKNFPS